jgi:hypothetical protein
MPDGLLFRGKYVGKTRNNNGLYEPNKKAVAISVDARS